MEIFAKGWYNQNVIGNMDSSPSNQNKLHSLPIKFQGYLANVY